MLKSNYMKRFLFMMLFAAAVLGVNAQDKKVAISGAYTASSESEELGAAKAVDGDITTFWHSPYSSGKTTFPVSFTVNLKEVSHVDYIRYIPRQDGTSNGNWNDVDLSYATTTNGTDFVKIATYKLGGASAVYDFIIPDGGVECGRVRFTIRSGAGNYASAAEIEAYAIDNTKKQAFAQYFEDDLYTVLKPGVTSSNGIADADVKKLVDNLLADAAGYKKFRVGEYEAYMTTSTLRNNLKISSQYNNYENPTGVYLKAGESCIVVASGIGEYSVGVKIKNWVVNESSSAYSLRNGLNVITAQTEGNVFVNYYTDDFEKAPNVKVHFVNAPVQGYWDQETMTNDDWKALLKNRASNDSTVLITRSRHAQLAYPVCSWLKHCPTDVDSVMTMYEQVDGARGDRYSGTVGHAISVVGDISEVFQMLEDAGISGTVADEDVTLTYTKPAMKVLVGKDGKIINGTWTYTVDIDLRNFTVRSKTVEKASAVIEYEITVNGGFKV